MSSIKEIKLNEEIQILLSGKALEAYNYLVQDEEIQHLQNYANTVSIVRLKYNDHGPVHMRKVALNALKIMDILNEKGIALNLEQEMIGTFEDSQTAVLIAAFLHDIGMSIGRAGHEHTGALLAINIIDRVLLATYQEDLEKRVILRSLIMECIIGHMGTHPIHSLEAGIILIADGCDMEKGRSRIPLMINHDSRVGDIHKYSASVIDLLTITDGLDKPIKIYVHMLESVGIFQVEEVLFPKLQSSPIKSMIEVWVQIREEEPKRYL
ncbi:HD domain-containing protein [Spirochaeta cellobiosiphila]|uniref:HD domain-containing protein n=1 Tax=Spirochaeta cellobiosiphila TaxID=504483 RepID=UPI0004082934|nr:HD domain-containing protein [Spirochaeta cellobiosiphila]